MALTINDTAARVQYTATEGQTAFTVPFDFLLAGDLKVYNGETLLAYAATPASAAQYSVTGAGVDGGGSITLGGSGATAGDVITILADIPVERVTDFPLSGPFQVEALNRELSRMTSMLRQLQTVIEQRALIVPDFDTPTDLDPLPAKDDRKGKLLAFNATTGQPEVGPAVETATSIAEALDSIEAVAADLALGGGSLIAAALDNANLAQAWAEGTEPGGVGTKSALEWSGVSQAFAHALTTGTFGLWYDSLAAGAAETPEGEGFLVIAGGRVQIARVESGVGVVKAELATVAETLPAFTAFTFGMNELADAAAWRTALGLGALALLGSINNSNWSGTALALANGGTGATTASGARTNLGLGALALLSTINNSNWSGTPLSLANGGTGATTAANALTALGGIGLTSATFGTNTITLHIALSNGDTLLIQGGVGSMTGNSTGTITFGTPYSVAPVVIAGGGSTSTGASGDVHISSAASVTGVSIVNSTANFSTYTWFAIGKA